MESILAVGWVMMGLSGISLATQSGVNTTLAAHIGRSAAAVVSMVTGLIAILIYVTIETQVFGGLVPTLKDAQATPWWSWFGGPLGSSYMFFCVLFAARMGAANAMSAFVSFLLIQGLVLDSFGLAGYAQRRFHWARAVGVALLIVGVYLVAKFDNGTEPANSMASLSMQDSGSTDTISDVDKIVEAVVEVYMNPLTENREQGARVPHGNPESV